MANRPPSLVTTATARSLVVQLGRGGRSTEIAARLEDAIRLGVIRPGARLPSEATLAEQLQVSPVTLREALALLRERDLIETRRGRSGGSFVRGTDDAHADGLDARLLSLAPHELRDLQDHRAAISSTTARLAAARATTSAVHEISAAVHGFAGARDVAANRQADTRFHVEIAAAAQSPRLTAEVLGLWVQVGDLVWLPVADSQRASLVAERAEIAAAISCGAGSRAHALMVGMIDSETIRLLSYRMNLVIQQ
ncbi:MAG: GntR family transcriptional regulator [Gordonia sp. (in: high G+C Gram-positive bacteria)]